MSLYYINSTEVSETKSGRTDSGTGWLTKSTLWPMVFRFAEFSFDYGMDWAGKWADKIDDMGWVRRAMENTYRKLSDEDKEIIRDKYELFLAHDKFCDWQAMANPSFDALCYLIDGQGRRVESEGVLVTVVRELAGTTKEEALLQLNTDCYEFIEWM